MKILRKGSASSTEGVQLLFWQVQHSIIRLQPHRAHFENALKSQIFYLPSNFSAIYFSSCSPAVRADLNEILPKLFNPHLLCFKKCHIVRFNTKALCHLRYCKSLSSLMICRASSSGASCLAWRKLNFPISINSLKQSWYFCPYSWISQSEGASVWYYEWNVFCPSLVS